MRDEEGMDSLLLAKSNGHTALIEQLSSWPVASTEALLASLSDRASARLRAKREAATTGCDVHRGRLG
jgi:hypothetical protein